MNLLVACVLSKNHIRANALDDTEFESWGLSKSSQAKFFVTYNVKSRHVRTGWDRVTSVEFLERAYVRYINDHTMSISLQLYYIIPQFFLQWITTHLSYTFEF